VSTDRDVNEWDGLAQTRDRLRDNVGRQYYGSGRFEDALSIDSIELIGHQPYTNLVVLYHVTLTYFADWRIKVELADYQFGAKWPLYDHQHNPRFESGLDLADTVDLFFDLEDKRFFPVDPDFRGVVWMQGT
jgi:hypothetical protein